VIGEAESGFTGAIAVAAAMTGFQIDDMGLWLDQKLVWFHWQTAPKAMELKIPSDLSYTIEKAAREYLIQRGEPGDYLQLHAASLQSLGQENLFPSNGSPAENYAQTQECIQSVLY
jgi:hypothetical protein